MLRKIIALILCFSFVMLSLFGCMKSDEKTIEDTIEDFVKAYNAGDMDSVLETFSYKKRTALKSYMELINGIGFGLGGFSAGLDASAIFGISVSSVSDDEDMMELEIIDIDVDEDEEGATVEVEAVFNTKYSEEYYEGEFFMVKEDDEWYIDDMDLSKIRA